MLYSSYTFLIP